jgi:hypothetical protein
VKIQEVEAWALQVIDAAATGKVEDARVELKAVWPDAKKAARRIAGHANAAGGMPILWLIGVKEGVGIVPRGDTDTADWWAQVKAEFDEGTVPHLVDRIIHVGATGSVAAMCFRTDLAPYVVKNSDGGTVAREVPWREGTSVRSARRSDLLRVLVPMQRLPRVEIIDASLAAYKGHHEIEPGDESWGPDVAWVLSATLYFSTTSQDLIALPHRLMSAQARSGAVVWAPQDEVYVGAQRPAVPGFSPKGLLQTIHNGVDQLIVNGPGYGWLTARGTVADINGAPPAVAQVDEFLIEVTLEGSDLPGPMSATCVVRQAGRPLGQINPNELAYWKSAT